MNEMTLREQFALPDAAGANVRPGRRVIGIALLLWCLALGGGWGILACYSHRPGDLLRPPLSWPAGTHLPGPVERPQLLVFAHPRCPCTRATLAELERLLARRARQLDACVVFTKPIGTVDGWEATGLLHSAASIAGVKTWVDDGSEASRFRACTSGLALLYDRRGRLVFYGGLTSSRGHEGDSAGLASLREFLDRGSPQIAQARVFGCPLQTP